MNALKHGLAARQIVLCDESPEAIADLNPRRISAVDAVPAEFSGFWNYVGSRPNIDYIVAGDFSLADVPD